MRHPSKRILCLLAIALIVAPVLAGTAWAQVVRGTVRDATGNPVSGVVIILADSTRRVVARALSPESGEFRLASPNPGRFILITRRIGFEPGTSTEFGLTSGQALEKGIVVSAIRTILETVQVKAQTSCDAGLDTQSAAFAVWEQARTALTAAQLTAASRGVQATTLTYARSLDPVRLRVVSQRQAIRTDYVRQPWQAASPSALHAGGYVVRNRDGSSIFHAPSLEALLSEEFVGDHCFRVSSNAGDSVALHFEPTRDRRALIDIRGDVILGRSSATLRGVNFEYAGLRSEEEGFGGGRLEFTRMRNGGWTINRWEVRMPALEQVERPASMGGPAIRVRAVEASGGELILATLARSGMATGRDTVWSQPASRLAGTVRDSSTGEPVSGARVELVGATQDATTNARGEFAFANVLLGRYTASIRTPSLENAGIAVQQAIDFVDPRMLVELRVPTAEQLRQTLCGAMPSLATSGVITGQVVRSSDSLGVMDAEVEVRWTEIALRDEHGVVVTSRPARVVGKTDASGRFRICNAPLSGAWITASTGREMSADQPVSFGGERLARIDLLLDRAIVGKSRLGIRVVGTDTGRVPVVGAEVTLTDVARSFSTNTAGRIDVANLASGDHRVTIRRLGYTPLDTTVTLRDGAIADLTFELVRINTLDSVVVSATTTDRALRSFEENVRLGTGHFMTRQRLVELKGQPLRRALSELQGISLVYGHGSRSWVAGARQPGALCGRVAPGASSECHRSHGIYDPSPVEAAQGMSASCYARVYIDGVLMNRGTPTPPYDANELLADQIEAIEYYASAAEVPLQYAGLNTDCGVLIIHGRRA